MASQDGKPLVSPLISDFSFGELSPKMTGRSDSNIYHKGAATIQNFVPMVQGGFRKRAGTVRIGNAYASDVRLHKMVISSSLWYLLEFTNNLVRFWKNGTTLLTGKELVTTYLTAELSSLQFGWAYPYLFIVHNAHAPAVIYLSGADTFALATPTVVGSTPQRFAGTTTIGSNTIATVTPDPTLASYTIDGKPISGPGIPLNTTVVSHTSSSIVISQNATANGSSTYAVSQDTTLPFQSASNYPAAVACAGQRVYFFSSINNPTKCWASEVGVWDSYGCLSMPMSELVQYTIQQLRLNGGGQPLDASNVVVSAAAGNTPAYDTVTETQEVVGDADGFEGSIYSDSNDSIQWAVAALDLVIGTLSGEWYISGDANANTFAFYALSKIGTSTIQAVFIPGGILFIDRPGTRVILVSWQGSQVQMPPSEILSVFSDHLFNSNPITAFTWLQSPNVRLCFLRTDGTVVCCEYDEGLKQCAWWNFVTTGTVRSIVSGPGTYEDTLYIAVDRTSGCCIEAVQTMDWTSAISGASVAVYLDCATVKYSGTPFSTVAVSTVFNGLTLSLVCDGAYVGTAVVAAGSVTLPVSCNTAVVGFPFTSILETMPIDIGSAQDSFLGKASAISRVSVIYWKTLDASVGTIQSGNFETAVLGGVNNALASPAVFTGLERGPEWTQFLQQVAVVVKSTKPLPCAVTAIIPEVTTYE